MDRRGRRRSANRCRPSSNCRSVGLLIIRQATAWPLLVAHAFLGLLGSTWSAAASRPSVEPPSSKDAAAMPHDPLRHAAE
ncbi:MAG: hypothetical protein U0841_00865 [Chloroflexia bacterium]